jgi:UDP-N-acetylglucosamine/UDP-N-acetylgalactosamine diphosphorylase
MGKHRDKGQFMAANEGNRILTKLQDKGVTIPCPKGVEIGSDVDPGRISAEGVTIHTGCKITGKETLILPGVVLGSEGPVTVRNCQLGRDVELGGGFFDRSCFLHGSRMGSGAQVREGCLLEEAARGAHTVGLKQTVLFPWVTLGSLVNFCDCLMAGGTDAGNHSEVGSSYIHFNYTPHQDKATPSLLGDVPHGVLLNQPPIFLGGQGGLVGPVRITYGTVVAAGTIVRKDLLRGHSIVLGHASISKQIPFHPGLFTNLKRILLSNANYIGNLMALRRWYLDVRIPLFRKDPVEETLLLGAVDKLEGNIQERVRRLGEIAHRMPRSIELLKEVSGESSSSPALQKSRAFMERWSEIEETFYSCMEMHGDISIRDSFLASLDRNAPAHLSNYLETIRGLPPQEAQKVTAWLQGVVAGVIRSIGSLIPEFNLPET